jgi:hypothetical protein
MTRIRMKNKVLTVEPDGSIVVPMEAFWHSVDDPPELTESHDGVPHCKWSKPVLIAIRGEKYPVVGFYEEATKERLDGPYKEWHIDAAVGAVDAILWMHLPEVPNNDG